MAKSAALVRTNEPNEDWIDASQSAPRLHSPVAGGALWRRASDLAILKAEPKFPALQIPGIPLLQNGLERGTIMEIAGRRSSGRTASLLHMLAQATLRGEVCAVVDAHNAFHPASADGAGVQLNRVVWVRCGGRIEHAIRSVDLILHAGGFGMVVLDLCETNPKLLNRIPLSYWFRFRRAIENTPTILIVLGEENQAKSCSRNNLKVELKVSHWRGNAGFRLLRGAELTVNLRKPVMHSSAQFFVESA